MLTWSDTLFVAVAALAFDALIGDPDWLWRRLPHPVALIGSFIGFLDRTLNRETWSPAQRQSAGACAVILLLIVSTLCGVVIEAALRPIPFGSVLLGLTGFRAVGAAKPLSARFAGALGVRRWRAHRGA